MAGDPSSPPRMADRAEEGSNVEAESATEDDSAAVERRSNAAEAEAAAGWAEAGPPREAKAAEGAIRAGETKAEEPGARRRRSRQAAAAAKVMRAGALLRIMVAALLAKGEILRRAAVGSASLPQRRRLRIRSVHPVPTTCRAHRFFMSAKDGLSARFLS